MKWAAIGGHFYCTCFVVLEFGTILYVSWRCALANPDRSQSFIYTRHTAASPIDSLVFGCYTSNECKHKADSDRPQDRAST